MKVLNLNLLYVALFFTLLSCTKKDSSDVDPEAPIYQDLKVVYDVAKSETKALATFREGDEDGSRLTLDDGASIFINKEKVEYSSNVTNYFYKIIFDDLLDVNYVLTKNNGDTFTNSVLNENRPNLIMTNLIDTLSLSGGSKVSWTSSLEGNESVSYFVKQGIKSGGAGYYAQTGSVEVTISSIIVEGLNEGAAELHIGREKVIKEINEGDQGNSNGQFVVETAIVHEVYLKK